jgi:vesicle coat complex subunit
MYDFSLLSKKYSDRIDNAGDLLGQFIENFLDDSTIVQLSLLTATVKLFIRKPAIGQELIPRVLKYATEDVDHVDLRERGYFYWRLLATNPLAAKVMFISMIGYRLLYFLSAR